jgi:hypothetical protein
MTAELHSGSVRRRRGVFLIAAAACAGCSLFSSFGGLSDGVRDDGGTRTSEAEDASQEGPTPRDGAPTDAGLGDIELARDASSDTWCGAHGPYGLCDDFDEAPLGARWDEQSVSGGTLTIDGTRVKSPAGALLATTEADGAPNVTLSATRASSGTGFVCDFDILLDQLDSPDDGALAVFWVSLTPTSSDVTFYWWRILLGLTTWYVNEYGTLPDGGEFHSNPFVPSLSVTTWRHVRVAMSFLASESGSVAVDFDTTRVYSHTLRTPQSSSLKLQFGVRGTSAGASKVRYDNVLCNFTP